MYDEYKRFCKLLFLKEFNVRPIELPIIGVNGVKKWYRLKGHISTWGTKEDFVVIVFKDITEEKKLYSKLFYSEEKLKTVLASELIVFFSIDQTGKIINLEGMPLEKLQFINSDFIGRDVFQLFELESEFLKNISECLKGVAKHTMLNVRNHFFDIIMFPGLETDEDNSFKITGMAIDVTDRELNRLSLDQHKEALVRSSKLAALGEMASGISHEINNPLTVIYGYMCSFREMIKSRSIDFEESEKIVNDIIRTSERIEKIIDGLRIFSRDGGGEDFQVTNIEKIISETLFFCEQRIKNNNINLRIMKFENEIFVNVRAVQISEILLNLLNNAFDAVVKSTNPWISLEWKIKNKLLIISISNSGPKISNDIIAKLFQPFFTTKPEGSGTGLGLSISKGLAQANAGNLQFDLDNNFTKFDLVLPIS